MNMNDAKAAGTPFNLAFSSPRSSTEVITAFQASLLAIGVSPAMNGTGLIIERKFKPKWIVLPTIIGLVFWIIPGLLLWKFGWIKEILTLTVTPTPTGSMVSATGKADARVCQVLQQTSLTLQ
jgi:hypothetical protein